MTYTTTRDQLIAALINEYELLTHDDYDPAIDMSHADYAQYVRDMSYNQLVAEATVDDIFTVDEFIANYG